MTDLLTTLALCLLPFVVAALWADFDERRKSRKAAKAQHPGNRALVRVYRRPPEPQGRLFWVDLRTGRTFSVADEAEAYLAGREPRR